MKSIEKVKQQARMKRANFQSEHVHGIGFMSKIINSNIIASKQEKRANRKHTVRRISRKANM
jgi:hypothetical protein